MIEITVSESLLDAVQKPQILFTFQAISRVADANSDALDMYPVESTPSKLKTLKRAHGYTIYISL